MIDTVLLIKTWSEGRIELPFGLLYVGASVKTAGYHVDIIDFQAESNYSIKEFIGVVQNFLEKHPNTIIGITSLPTKYKWVKDFSIAFKEKYPNIPIIVGGHIVSASKLLLSKSKVDYICMKEGEELLPELIDAINKGNHYPDIPGLSFRKDNTIHEAKKRKPLTKLINPDFSLIHLENYLLHPKEDIVFRQNKKYLETSTPTDKLVSIMFSRGCVGSCTFCQRHLPGFRQHPVDDCIDYISMFYHKYGITYFRFVDELFLYNIEWFNEFYEKLSNSGLDIMFRIAGARADFVTDDILTKLKKMGCIGINFGIESGSQKILNIIRKRTTVKQNKEAIKKSLEYGMYVIAYYIIGYEGETEKTLKETFDFIIDPDIRSHDFKFAFPIPVPGTVLYKNSVKRGIINDDEKYFEEEYNKIASKKRILKLGDVGIEKLLAFKHKVELLFKVDNLFKKRIPFSIVKFLVMYTTLFEIAKVLKKALVKK
jgi:radical SAM superfamily enzyme YgiQ (UPF0313 family)